MQTTKATPGTRIGLTTKVNGKVIQSNWFIRQYKKGCTACRVIGRVLHVIIPGAISTYLLHQYNDMAITTLASGFAVYAAFKLIQTAIDAETK